MYVLFQFDYMVFPFRFIDVENKRLVLVESDPLQSDVLLEEDTLKSDNILEYKSKHQAFYKIMNYFTKLYKEKYNGDYIALIKVSKESLYVWHARVLNFC